VQFHFFTVSVFHFQVVTVHTLFISMTDHIVKQLAIVGRDTAPVEILRQVHPTITAESVPISAINAVF